ncbi:monovalent cation/H+ antiporter subunit E [Corynebacterium glutamicum]|uniref:monovalent cation/H+ antiporter subunit E n=1 Tax=Corynebacterium glutamicum TaxID=1718 RepID=UPI00097B8D78|nr:monovalent cation/H+ antiporter subunit E [Corynebacterium glutamicum]GAV96033.1 monovalent cation/H+ antiporter subunit E [Corynebacterium glutamicum]GFK17631.1 cation:proton antiporter [Corynebacterium glutamicum]
MLNALKFIPWLIGQIFLSGFSVITAAVKKDTGFNPVVIRYPLRVTTDFQIAALSTCITATPSTLSLGLREPRKPGHPTILLIQAVFGSDPVEVFESIADMEQRLVPSVASIDHGVPGQGPYKEIRPGDAEWPSREIADTAQNTVSQDKREF